ncbi:MAG: MT-A70 family methyltransferase [Gammaproteobacteria bacterium]|nr:MT-A70 family methyltransferase [Gammaproteobacteria bacterium]
MTNKNKPGRIAKARIPVLARMTAEFLDAYSRGVTAIWDAGQVLVNAKGRMEHGQFTDWIENTLPISPRTARQLMQIARDPNITRTIEGARDGKKALPLPGDRNTLTEIAGLEEEKFNGLVDSGVIHPEMRRGDLRVGQTRAAHPAEPPCPLEALRGDLRYGAILADPPWKFRGGKSRSAERHYPTMELQQIEMLPIMELAADDAVLFLWITSDMLHHAPRIMIQWGFEYKTVAFVWLKPPPSGLGYWTRKNTELCLLGIRGKPQRLNAHVSDLIMAPRRRHSEKPDETYIQIEKLVAGPYIELFARAPREGWDAWGNDPALMNP